MKFEKKILLVFFIILIGLSVVFSSCIISLEKHTEKVPSHFEKLILQTETSKIFLKKADTSQLIYEHDERLLSHNIEFYEDTFKITESTKEFRIDLATLFGKYELNLDSMPKEIFLHSSDGNINLYGITAEKISVLTQDGDIYLQECSSVEEINIKTEEGNIYLQECSSAEEINIKTEESVVYLNLKDVEDYTINFSSASINLMINGQRIWNTSKIYGNGDKIINFESQSSDLIIFENQSLDLIII